MCVGWSPAHFLPPGVSQHLPHAPCRPGTAPLAVVGHSLGGKVALEVLAQMQIARMALPKQTWVLDSQPGAVPAEVDARTGVVQVLQAVKVREQALAV